MKKYAPRKVFIIENGEYVEISYEELCRREGIDPSYKDKLFLPLHGMLMEVSKAVYDDFYRAERRQKYIIERSIQNGDISVDALGSDEFNGANIVIDGSCDVSEQVIHTMMLERLQIVMPLLSEEERELIYALFYCEKTEREWSKISGIPQKTINDRKKRILAKLKKLMES